MAYVGPCCVYVCGSRAMGCPTGLGVVVLSLVVVSPVEGELLSAGWSLTGSGNLIVLEVGVTACSSVSVTM